MFVIVKQETHPDRFIEDEAIGPFATYEQAASVAHKMDCEPGGNLWYHKVLEVKSL